MFSTSVWYYGGKNVDWVHETFHDVMNFAMTCFIDNDITRVRSVHCLDDGTSIAQFLDIHYMRPLMTMTEVESNPAPETVTELDFDETETDMGRVFNTELENELNIVSSPEPEPETVTEPEQYHSKRHRKD